VKTTTPETYKRRLSFPGHKSREYVPLEFSRKLERENTKLRALLSEPYGFFTFGHKALSPWGKALDNWCERAKPLLEKKKAQP